MKSKDAIQLHKYLVTEFKKKSGNGTKHSWNYSYLGHNHFSYHLSNPVKHEIIKGFVSEFKDLDFKTFKRLLDVLYSGKSYDEKSAGGRLLNHYKKHRSMIKPQTLKGWLTKLEGWAEIDSLCQSVFSAEEMLNNWSDWSDTLESFSKDKNISVRRASLVLLTGPVSKSADEKMFQLGLKNIDRLKLEKDILITKAVSWLLRSMVKHHKTKVSAYLKENAETLPKIAVRETTRKILTGKK